MPGAQIQQQNFGGNRDRPERVNRKERSRLRLGGVKRERLAHPAIAEQIPHRSENRLQRVDQDQDRNDHRPTDQNRDAIFESVTPAPQPMAPPEDSEHGDAADKSRDILEGLQERLDVIGNLLRRDDQHGNGERKRGVDESFQARHLQAAQSESAEPRERIEICRQGRANFLMSLFHPSLVNQESLETGSFAA